MENLGRLHGEDDVDGTCWGCDAEVASFVQREELRGEGLVYEGVSGLQFDDLQRLFYLFTRIVLLYVAVISEMWDTW